MDLVDIDNTHSWGISQALFVNRVWNWPPRYVFFSVLSMSVTVMTFCTHTCFLVSWKFRIEFSFAVLFCAPWEKTNAKKTEETSRRR